jgi:DNA polymerase-3 subunit delta'
MYIRPNEADHKIYLFPRAHDMRDESQNALLKILEEPPSYGVFILLTNNAERMLPTIRSRCTELAMASLQPAVLKRALRERFPQGEDAILEAAAVRSGGFLGQAIQIVEEGNALPPETTAFLQAYAQRDALALMEVLVPMEKWKRDQLIPVLEQWTACLEGALLHRSGVAAVTPMAERIGTARSAAELLHTVRQLQTCLEYARGNVSPGAICGHLVWMLR